MTKERLLNNVNHKVTNKYSFPIIKEGNLPSVITMENSIVFYTNVFVDRLEHLYNISIRLINGAEIGIMTTAHQDDLYEPYRKLEINLENSKFIINQENPEFPVAYNTINKQSVPISEIQLHDRFDGKLCYPLIITPTSEMVVLKKIYNNHKLFNKLSNELIQYFNSVDLIRLVSNDSY